MHRGSDIYTSLLSGNYSQEMSVWRETHKATSQKVRGAMAFFAEIEFRCVGQFETLDLIATLKCCYLKKALPVAFKRRDNEKASFH